MLLLPFWRNESRFLPSRRDLTAGRPVCVLTDLLSRLEEEYSTPPRMSSRSSLDSLVGRRQGHWRAPAGTARAAPTSTRHRYRLPTDEHRRTVTTNSGWHARCPATARPSPAPRTTSARGQRARGFARTSQGTRGIYGRCHSANIMRRPLGADQLSGVMSWGSAITPPSAHRLGSSSENRGQGGYASIKR
jgi:hypothetical protein